MEKLLFPHLYMNARERRSGAYDRLRYNQYIDMKSGTHPNCLETLGHLDPLTRNNGVKSLRPQQSWTVTTILVNWWGVFRDIDESAPFWAFSSVSNRYKDLSFAAQPIMPIMIHRARVTQSKVGN